MDGHFVADLRRHFKPVIAVLIGQNHLFETRTSRRHHLFFDASHAQNSAAQADLARHGDVRAHDATAQERSQGDCDGHARAGTVLGGGAGGHMDVNIAFVVSAEIDV